MPMLKLYNSLTQKKEIFSTKKNKVSMYVCGITPYDTTHLGHAFTYVWFDVLYRYLKLKGFKIKYTQNVTDINDRDNDILKRAKEQNITWKKLSGYWTNIFLNDMKKLNWVKPDTYINASDYIPQMISLINKLLKNKFAYIGNNSVYLDISKKKDFGKLSKLNSRQMLKIAKEFEEDIDNPDKRNPLDITLWRGSDKNTPSHIPSFKSPFGLGRPGWHLECSSMSTSTLADQIDIHGGGEDLIYPHHESEIAQSEGATLKIPFSRFWMHTASVYCDGDKMSKSLGNIVLVRNLLKKTSPNILRYLILSTHYRKNWDFSEKQIERAEKQFAKIKFSKNLEFKKTFEKIMDDDLNVPTILSSNPSKKAMRLLGFEV
jgi:cysteinyl-tRNA synthetase